VDSGSVHLVSIPEEHGDRGKHPGGALGGRSHLRLERTLDKHIMKDSLEDQLGLDRRPALDLTAPY
jgi:hypothetical protein